MSNILPSLYDFPPFYTIQPNEASRRVQLEEWSSFLLRWCGENKKAILTWREWPYWENKKIDRKLSEESILIVLEHIIQKNRGEWTDPNTKAAIHIFYKTPAEWAHSISEYISKIGAFNTLYTVYELHSGPLGMNSVLENMEPDTLLKALEVMESQGKAILYKADIADETAVKFIG